MARPTTTRAPTPPRPHSQQLALASPSPDALQHASELPAGQRTAVRGHPVAVALSTRLEGVAAELDELQVPQVLWAHAQLRHGSTALVDRLLSRLAQAEVQGPASEGAGAGAGVGRQRRRRAAASLRLHNLNALVMLCYAQAKMARPVRQVLSQLTDALLAAPDRPAAAVAPEGVAEGQRGSPDAVVSDGICALSGRSLCLLLWSLASMGALPPALLLRGTRELRRRGLADLSVHSMCLVITAQELCWQPAGAAPPAAGSAAAAAAHAATSGGARGAALGAEQPPGAPQAAAPAPGPAAAVPGCWDQSFMNAVANELTQRSRGRRSGFWLNGQDCCTLARGFALAWQASLGWGGGSGGVLEAPLGGQAQSCWPGRPAGRLAFPGSLAP